MSRKYLVAEYCEGPFYMGWWLYLRDRNDGSENDGRWERWGWLQCHCHYQTGCGNWCPIQKVADFCRTLGYDPPPSRRYSQDVAEWFARTFPGGLLVETEGGYQLISKVARPPKQVRRGVIRTIARAERSFEKACARSKS